MRLITSMGVFGGGLRVHNPTEFFTVKKPKTVANATKFNTNFRNPFQIKYWFYGCDHYHVWSLLGLRTATSVHSFVTARPDYGCTLRWPPDRTPMRHVVYAGALGRVKPILWVVNTQLGIVGLWSLIDMHRCYNLLQHNELALWRNKRLCCLIFTDKTP